MEIFYRSWSPCIGGGGYDQKMAWTGLGSRVQACRSGGRRPRRCRATSMDLGSEGSRCSAWPTNHSDKLPDGDDGAFLRTMKPMDGEGASPTCGSSRLVLRRRPRRAVSVAVLCRNLQGARCNFLCVGVFSAKAQFQLCFSCVRVACVSCTVAFDL